MDVVPVYENLWTHPPFGADMDEDGKIYARGTQVQLFNFRYSNTLVID